MPPAAVATRNKSENGSRNPRIGDDGNPETLDSPPPESDRFAVEAPGRIDVDAQVGQGCDRRTDDVGCRGRTHLLEPTQKIGVAFEVRTVESAVDHTVLVSPHAGQNARPTRRAERVIAAKPLPEDLGRVGKRAGSDKRAELRDLGDFERIDRTPSMPISNTRLVCG